MLEDTRYLLVDVKVLPEALLKVVEAKRLLAQGKAKSLSEATRMVGISRSAFYKYKDSVFAYTKQNTREVATLFAELVDEPGVLSSLLSMLSKHGANILTINQNIPADGVAPISISMRCDNMERQVSEVMEEIKEMYGVVGVRLIAG